MTDLKISALTDGGGLKPDDELAVARAGSSFRALGIGTDGWVSDVAETWTFGSFTAGPPAVGTFTVPGDKRSKYTVGTRIKLTQTTVKYFVVSADPTYDGTNTTVTITGGTDYTLANATITVNYHSYAANPQGYPTWFNFAAAATGFSSKSSDDGIFALHGRNCTVFLAVTGVSNSANFTWTAPIPFSTSLNGIATAQVLANGGSTVLGRALLSSGATTVTMGASVSSSGGFSASGTKGTGGAGSTDNAFIYPV